jgi:uncharacterized protein YndB with AHSA1/START domain
MSVTHATFVVERTYEASPERVFTAFADPRERGQWFVGPDGWEESGHKFDFRVGGTESVSGGPPGGPVHHYHATFQDIVPNERIISSYEMHQDDVRTSVSLATVEFHHDGTGTRLVYTEQGAWLDGIDSAESREEGTSVLLDQLGVHLKG